MTITFKRVSKQQRSDRHYSGLSKLADKTVKARLFRESNEIAVFSCAINLALHCYLERVETVEFATLVYLING